MHLEDCRKAFRRRALAKIAQPDLGASYRDCQIITVEGVEMNSPEDIGSGPYVVPLDGFHSGVPLLAKHLDEATPEIVVWL
jgi:hypothetical protein